MIRYAGLICMATAVVIAVVDLGRRSTEPDRPCVYCGRMLSAPLYECKHHLGDGKEASSLPAISW
jgi:hypothetical protein